MWTLFAFVVAGAFAVNYVQKSNKKADAEGEDVKAFISKFIGSLVSKTDDTREANQEHLDLAIKRAESRLLLQDAQKPAAHRFKFTPCVHIG